MCAMVHTTRHSPALGQARIMQPTTAALGDAPQAPRGLELSTFGLGAECDTDYATGAPNLQTNPYFRMLLCKV